jgi:hypothetical protein
MGWVGTEPPGSRMLQGPESVAAPGRMTTKSGRCRSAVGGSGIGGRMRHQSPFRQWRVGSDAEEGVT